ncbi:MAG: FHA domain-containing protein [Sandaracinaceae bacterium]|nr:FHA domain-containing protein [Sandaracinaceae bacterium]
MQPALHRLAGHPAHHAHDHRAGAPHPARPPHGQDHLHQPTAHHDARAVHHHHQPFLIGRSSECHLAVDDSLVSRRHAALDVRADGVRIRDLGSRNGVSVNGTLISGSHELTHMDRITIGAQQMVFVEFQQSAPATRPTTDMVRCMACGAFE